MVQGTKLVHGFDEGSAAMGELLGGKGANLCEMARLGLPVPPGFVITTEACLEYFNRDHQLPEGLWDEVQEHMSQLEKAAGRSLGSKTNPLLVSVRSGARVSMPGMMDTILNLGINDEIVHGLGALMRDDRPAFDAYRRFLQIYASVVLGTESKVFEGILAQRKERAGVREDYELNAHQLQDVIDEFNAAILSSTDRVVPQDPWEQLCQAIEAVFKSWNSPRAISYRDHYKLPHDWGTAVNIVAMVFGNLGEDSGSGVLFTRNPTDGKQALYGEYLSNGQGEDVCSRRRPWLRPPGSSACLRCWPAPARRPGQGDGQRVPAGPDAGRGWPAGADRHWPPGGDRQRRYGYGRGGCVVASIGCSFSGTVLLLQNHYPRFRGAPSGHFRMLTKRPPSVDSG